MRRLAVILLFLVCLASAKPATAESTEGDVAPGEAIVLVVAAGTPLDQRAVARAIAEELGTPVIPIQARGAREARGTLILTDSISGDRLLFVYRAAAGGEVWRSFALDPNADTVLRSVALVAGNLVRDQASQLLNDLGVVEDPESPTEPDPPVEPEPPAEPEPAPEPACPQCEESAEERRRRLLQTIPERAYSDPLAFGLHAVTAFQSSSISTRFDLQAAYRWNRFALGLSTRSGSFELCTAIECLDVRQGTLLAEGDFRFRGGPLTFELGLAFGLGMHRFLGLSGSFVRYRPHGRVQISAVIPIGPGVDLIARTEAATTFLSVEGEGMYDAFELSLWEVGVGVGVRLHPNLRRDPR